MKRNILPFALESGFDVRSIVVCVMLLICVPVSCCCACVGFGCWDRICGGSVLFLCDFGDDLLCRYCFVLRLWSDGFCRFFDVIVAVMTCG